MKRIIITSCSIVVIILLAVSCSPQISTEEVEFNAQKDATLVALQQAKEAAQQYAEVEKQLMGSTTVQDTSRVRVAGIDIDTQIEQVKEHSFGDKENDQLYLKSMQQAADNSTKLSTSQISQLKEVINKKNQPPNHSE